MQTVLITGAASGIGRETALLFAQAGWQCVLVDHNEQALRAVGASLPAPASAAHVLRTIDLTDAQQVATLREGTPALDAVLNNAGMSDASNTPLVEQVPTQMERLLALNLAAPAAVVEACAPLLKPGARIVNVSSGAGLNAIPWRGAYSPSKAGLIAQTRALAKAHPEWSAIVLCPGFVRTELVAALIEAGRLPPERAVAKIPLGRMAAPQEMAQALFFLGSEGAAPLAGEILAVNGGSSIYGGSQAFAPATLETLPFDLPTQLDVVGDGAGAWQALASAAPSTPHYSASLDVSTLHATGSLLRAVHQAAIRFAQQHAQQASLTVLLPPDTDGAWQNAGDGAAARMLVATLACEWGSRALRINAVQVPAGIDAQSLQPLLRFVSGAAAQYLTGQTLACRGPR
ncbi:SDR family oxidoreductase [Hydrogenophaga sp. BPS33]|uniref:SDR family oxidoreductase n=1 Tax=Hydrogenophaga sp. BPS33 TaxID=2651974 RepID=UPI00131FC87F|nr:SDR family oxidoreductase [Hydrogenophaga sp. BPS33]QHE84210.1 SDR family oxidoreductase [Hydrogenophaga sp. BPS33]